MSDGRTLLRGGTVTGLGGLPHRDSRDAARCSLRQIELPAIPSLPRRSPAEGAIVQAMVGMRGITVGQYASISVDPKMVDPLAPVVTDLEHDAFAGFRAFVELAPEVRPGLQAVKWQCIGPVSLGLALERAGVPAEAAFDAAVHCVRTRAQHLAEAVDAALPGVGQVVFVEEPALAEVLHPGFPLPPDVAIDLVSGALAAVEPMALVGLHVGGVADVPSQIAVGPAILSIPVQADVLQSAGYLIRFMERGGVIAWGAVSTSGPVATTVERAWRELNEVWTGLVERGADPIMLRRQAMITPGGGMEAHTPAVAERILRLAAEIGGRVRDQSSAERWVLGA